MTITTSPATSDRWNDVVTAFGRRGDDPNSCWCQRFMKPQLDETGVSSNRDALRREIEHASIAPGIVAYVDGTPAGWSRVMPRAAVALVQANRALRRILEDDPSAWWITCFVVDRRYRGMGVATALLNAAVGYARDHGASALEGHPVDTDALYAERVEASALFTGTMRTFVAGGFREIGRTYPSRPVMRVEL